MARLHTSPFGASISHQQRSKVDFEGCEDHTLPSCVFRLLSLGISVPTRLWWLLRGQSHLFPSLDPISSVAS
jgi:hypothetical protein